MLSATALAGLARRAGSVLALLEKGQQQLDSSRQLSRCGTDRSQADQRPTASVRWPEWRMSEGPPAAPPGKAGLRPQAGGSLLGLMPSIKIVRDGRPCP